MGLAALVALPAVIALACGGESGVEARRSALEQQRQQLLIQFSAAQNQVRRTQAQALEDPSLAPLRERFYDLLRERMIEIEPRAEAWLDRALELGPVIDDLSRPLILEPDEEPAPREEREQVVEEFAEIEKALQPVQNRALADPEVAAAFEEMQDSVHAVMIRLNPAAESALDQMRRASNAVDSLDAELRALED
ncbi:MAG TPA: hypothetical protein VLA33_03355 [Gemmatimonadota bacterium]|nr:hypothetical protein [Gemmatimonadota bacterium]